MEKGNDPKLFGSRISSCRQNRNMTQEELSSRLGVTPQALSKWERGISFPDVTMLADLSRLLGVSADWLLGIEAQKGEQEEDFGGHSQQFSEEIGVFLRNSLQAIELRFGVKLVPLFADSKFVEKIFEMRKRLAVQMGILLPVVRIRDDIGLDEQEFAVLAYHNVLHCEKLETLDENTMDYMLGKFQECVCQKYHEILHPDLMKGYIDNLKIQYPALIEGVVPEKIPYSLLTETARIVVSRGDSIIYLPKMIEIMDCALRIAPHLSAAELADRICSVIERPDNVHVMLGMRKESRKKTN